MDGGNCLDGYHVDHRVVQVYRRRCKLWNLGKRSLARLLLLRTSMTWKVIKVHCTRYGLRLFLPYLDGSPLDDWRHNGILVPTCYGFSPVLPHRSHSCEEENKVLKKEEEWTILTLTSGFLVIKVFNSRYWAKPPRS